MEPPAWTVWHDDSVLPAAKMIARDDLLLDEVARGLRPPTARLWQSEPCVVCPPAYRRLWDAAATGGGPPIFRSTGGGVVALGAGVALWSFAWARPEGEAESIDDAYRLVAREISMAAAEHGIAAEVMEIAPAMCRGRYDVAVAGRKIAGLSQRRIVREQDGVRRAALLVHAFILIDADLADIEARCNALAGVLGVEGTTTTALTTLSNATGRSITRFVPAGRMRSGISLQVA